MVTITYANLQTLVNDTSITATTCEAIIDHAVNKINGYGADLSNMAGGGGAKTLVVTSAEAGFIMSVAVAIYHKDYKISGAQSSSFGLGALSTTETASSAAGAEVESLAQNAARQLTEKIFQRA